MFGKKVEKAKSDWPIDRVNLKKLHVDIEGRYPSLRHADKAFLFTLLIVVPGLFVFWPVALALAVPVFMFFWMTFKRRLSIRISPDAIRVNGKQYALDQVREFRVEPHEKAYKPDPGAYAGALEVVMQYGEKRVVIAELREEDKDNAVALGLRLQNWVEKFEEMVAVARKGAQQETEPIKGDFGPSPDIR